MRWPIRLQILLPFSGVTLVLLLAVSGANAYMASHFARRAIDRQLQGIVKTLRETTFPLTKPVLRQLGGLSGAAFIVTDSAGHVRATTLPVGSIFVPHGTLSASTPLGTRLELNGQRYFCQQVTRRAPIRSADAEVIHVLYPEQNWRQAQRDAILPPLYIGSIAVAVTIMLALLVARRISLPIEQLQHHVGRIAAGDNRPLPKLPTRNDELRDLAQSINTLASQLECQRRAIVRAERFALLGQVGGGLAHQLRNAIAGARMAVQLHQETCSDTESESLQIALLQLESTERSLRQLLRAGQHEPLTRTRQPIATTLQQAVALVQSMCSHQQVDLRLTLPDFQLQWTADHEQLQQALVNLLHNAIDAAGRGGTVRLECRLLAADRLSIRVFDNGPGVSPEVEPRLFEPFVSSKREGVGLGLVLAKRVVEQHGGELRYLRTSETVFEILLPANQDTSSQPVRSDVN